MRYCLSRRTAFSSFFQQSLGNGIPITSNTHNNSGFTQGSTHAAKLSHALLPPTELIHFGSQERTKWTKIPIGQVDGVPIKIPPLRHNRRRNRKRYQEKQCEHGSAVSRCMQCESPGSQICEHLRRRSRCVLCGVGGSICAHGRNRDKCRECMTCEHFQRKTACAMCLGNSCPHGQSYGDDGFQCSMCG